MNRPALRALLVIAVVALWAASAPRALLGRDAEAFFDGDLEAESALAAEVSAYVKGSDEANALHTGSSRFDGEWIVVTHQMAALGLGQIALAHPERRAAYIPAIEGCAERLLSDKATAFGTEAWGERGLDHPESEHGHAYLGYVNLALSMLRLLDPGTRFADTNDSLTAALVRRLEASSSGLINTYPREAYPADVASVIGSIGLHARVRPDARAIALLEREARLYRERYVDARSGLLIQAADAESGRPAAPARASGTAIAAYFLSFAAPASPGIAALSSDLSRAIRASQRATFLGFGGVREYAPGEGGSGDIDSGPVIFGVSISATGFAIAGARMDRDRSFFRELYRTADLFGVPVSRGGGRRFMSGGALGNSILLAMATAAPFAPAEALP